MKAGDATYHLLESFIAASAFARKYAAEAFDEEESAEPTFEEPIVAADGRAAVEYRARIRTTEADDVNLFGVTMLRFDEDGLVREHRDYWALV